MKHLSLLVVMGLLVFSVGCSKSLVGDDPSLTSSNDTFGNTASISGGCSIQQTLVGNSCVCPGASHFDGNSCVSCGADQSWDFSSKSCVNHIVCGSGLAWDGNACVSTTDQNGVVCNSYQEVKSPFVIPARDSSRTCYFVKLSDAVASASSSSFTKRDDDIWSRDHDNWTQNPTHPHIMGSSANSDGAVANIQFVMQGTHDVALAGDASGASNVYVDNYILIKLGINGQNTYLAEGTSDSFTYSDSSIPNDTGFVVANGVNVTDFLVGASAGTASFAPTDFSAHLQPNTTVSLKSEALDCGVIGTVSDIYLMFK